MGPISQQGYCQSLFDTCKFKCPEYLNTQTEYNGRDIIEAIPIWITWEQSCRDACSLVYLQCINDFESSFSNDCGKDCVRKYHYDMNMGPFDSEQWTKEFTECRAACGPSLKSAKALSVLTCYNSLEEYKWCS